MHSAMSKTSRAMIDIVAYAMTAWSLTRAGRMEPGQADSQHLLRRRIAANGAAARTLKQPIVGAAAEATCYATDAVSKVDGW